MNLIISLDCTFKDTKSSDYVALTVWGTTEKDFYLLDCIRDRMGFTKTLDTLSDVINKYPDFNAILVEDKANGSAIIEIIQQRVRGVIPISPKESKLARAQAASTFFDSGNIYVPDPNRVIWVHDYIKELTQFPNAKNDDQVDSTTQALNYLRNKSQTNPSFGKAFSRSDQEGKLAW